MAKAEEKTKAVLTRFKVYVKKLNVGKKGGRERKCRYMVEKK